MKMCPEHPDGRGLLQRITDALAKATCSVFGHMPYLPFGATTLWCSCCGVELVEKK